MQRAFAFILNVRHRRRPDEEAKKPARPPRPSERGGGGIGSRLANPAEVVMALYDLSDRLNWQQACEILGCSKAQLYRLVKEKKIPVYGTEKDIDGI